MIWVRSHTGRSRQSPFSSLLIHLDTAFVTDLSVHPPQGCPIYQQFLTGPPQLT